MPDDTLLQSLLDFPAARRTIAVVGLSPDPARPSHVVARYLQAQGYRVIPVNPACREVVGETCYPDLQSIPGPVDIVDCFRKPGDMVPIAEAAIAIGARVLWMQLGVTNPVARQKAEQAGLTVIEDRCIELELMRWQQAGLS